MMTRHDVMATKWQLSKALPRHDAEHQGGGSTTVGGQVGQGGWTQPVPPAPEFRDQPPAPFLHSLGYAQG